MDGADYARGALETAEKTAENATKAIGRLCEILVAKKILTAEDIAFIATGYAESFEHVSFEE